MPPGAVDLGACLMPLPVIDLHSHILFGLDDGAADLGEALDIARAAVADGIAVIAATPHVRDEYPTTPDEMERRVADVQAGLAAEDIPLRVVGGGEIAVDWLDRFDDEELRRFGLGGSRYVLVETPYVGWPLDFAERLFALRTRGFRPVLAHPERSSEVQGAPELLQPLVAAGTLVQLTAASVDGRVGKRAQETSLRLLSLECAHLVASDAHAADVRAVGMSAAAAALRSPSLADWLTRAVPGAILADAPPPARPVARKSWFGRLMRT